MTNVALKLQGYVAEDKKLVHDLLKIVRNFNPWQLLVLSKTLADFYFIANFFFTLLWNFHFVMNITVAVDKWQI